MRSHLVIGETDYTANIVAGSYEVNSNDVYESWKDGNMLEHRIIVASKVNGKFSVAFPNGGVTLSSFLAAWNEQVVNGVVTLGLYVTNKDSFEALECYYKITSGQHTKSIGGKFYDVLNIEVTQR